MTPKTQTRWRSRITGHGEEVPDQLLANPGNWRIHPKSQQDALAGALGEVGWVQQVIVNTTTGHLVDGHLRVELAISAGEPSIPVVYVELSPEEEALVLATIDPIAAMAVPDQEKLAELIADLDIQDEALAAMLREMTPDSGKGLLTDPDEVPEVPVDPVTKPGDLWLLGEHRLLCGDSTDDAALDRLIVGKIGCVLTDPPYGIDLVTDYSGGAGRIYRPVAGDDQAFDAASLRSRFASVDEQFWFGANYYRRSLGGTDRDGSWLVWDKRGPSTDVVVGSGFELVWSAKPHKQDVLRFLWTNYTSHQNAGMEREHPTEKPVALLAEILNRWAPAGCVVADLFAGSGTTLIAAEQTGRTAYLMEIDPAYVDVIVKRWENATGNEANLDG